MRLGLQIVFLGCALLGSLDSHAYIPPSAFVIKSLANKHGGFKSVRVRSTVTAMDGEMLTSTKFKTVTYFNPQTSILHAYASDESGKSAFAIERRLESSTTTDALLFWSNPRQLQEHLKAQGLPIRTEDELAAMKDEDERRASEVQNLARWMSTVAWVIGDPPRRDAKGPQLWIEKDTFLPLRLVYTVPDEGLVDIQFEGQRFYREFPFPRAITVAKGGKAILRDEVQDVTLNSDANEFKTVVTDGFTEAGKTLPSATRELIDRYFKLVR